MVAAGGLAREGHHVTGLDVDGPKVEALERGECVIYEPGLDAWLAEGRPVTVPLVRSVLARGEAGSDGPPET